MCSQNSQDFICICPKLETPSLALLQGVDDPAVGACTWDAVARGGDGLTARGSSTRGGSRGVLRAEEARVRGHVRPDSVYVTF